ncbi:MAG: hypothetical protein KOO69_01640 [Victivallales bacterium]|nr:hypothetical protein [Victivallales bacterium]
MIQDVDCQKCGCSNKLGTIYCRNCGNKLKFNKAMLNTHKSQALKKIVKRAFKSLVLIAILSIIGLAFCPWGFPTIAKITDKDEISAVITTCTEIDDMLTKDTGKRAYEFTPAEATLAANYLSTEHERKKAEKQESMAFGSASLGGTTNMGGKTTLGGASGNMKFKNETAPAKPAYVDPEIARLKAWAERKKQDAIDAKKIILSPNFDFVIALKDEKTLYVVLKDTWMKFIPARLELCIVPELIINAKEKTQVMQYTIISARLGHLPIPLYLKGYVIDLFEEMLMQERRWAKQYFSLLTNVEIVNDNINVSFAK